MLRKNVTADSLMAGRQVALRGFDQAFHLSKRNPLLVFHCPSMSPSGNCHGLSLLGLLVYQALLLHI